MGLLDNILSILHQEKTTSTTRGEGHPSSFAASQQKNTAPQPPESDDDAPTEEELIAQELDREIQAFYAVLVDTMGSDKLV